MKDKIAIQRYNWIMTHLRKLIELDAPGIIKAQAFVNLFIPRFVEILDISEEFSRAIAERLCNSLNEYSGICTDCKKSRAIGTNDPNGSLCAKCLAKFDQVMQDYESQMTDYPDETR